MKREFPVTLDEMHRMLGFVRENVIAAGLSERDAGRMELAVEEALTNIIHYSGLQPTQYISIDCQAEENEIQIILEDEGTPFNPLSKSNKVIDPTIPIEDRELGGFGIHLILNLMDHVHYRYEKGKNILTLIKSY